MWAMQQFVADRVASSVNSRMPQRDGIKGITTTVNSNEATMQAPSSILPRSGGPFTHVVRTQ